jgi:2-dehydro-3-deoxy-D-gluconate 5-dehydrogenase
MAAARVGVGPAPPPEPRIAPHESCQPGTCVARSGAAGPFRRRLGGPRESPDGDTAADVFHRGQWKKENVPDELFDVTDLLVIVTGGARGIGRGAASALLERGANVVLWDIREDALAEATTGELAPWRERVRAEVVDVSAADAVERAAQAVLRDGPVDVLINCAGISSHRRPVLEIPQTDWDRMLAVNFTGTLHTCRALGRAMVAREAGSIINVSSIDAVDPSPGILHYAVSKAAVAMLTTGLAREWAASGVRVNAVGPGPILTPMTAPILESHPGLRERWEASVPLGRIGTPADLAGIFVYLASPASAWVTGRSFYIDGGWLL